MTYTPRYYQLDAVAGVWNWMRSNPGNPLAILPTGAGKSFVLSALCQEAVTGWDGTRVLIVSHVSELLLQDLGALLKHWPDAPAGLYSAGLGKRDIGKQILVAGIQSIYKKAYAVQRCDIMIIDEAHLVSRDEQGMYRRFIADLKSINPHMRVVGLTATAYRMDSGLLHEGEGALFDGVAYDISILKLIQEGYLCPVVAKRATTQIDLTGVGTRGGDYIPSALEAACDIDAVTQAAVSELVVKGADRGSWLVFCAGVKHAEHTRDAIRAHGITCETITGETSSAERGRFLRAFKRGEIRALTNMNCLTTGVDAPGVDLIAALRPTKSLSLYVQMLGRGTRNAEGKTDCLVLDFAGITKQHGPLDLVDGAKRGPKGEGTPPVKTCPECDTIVAASARTCTSCGYEFPPAPLKITAFANTAPVLSTQIVPEWIDVSAVRFSLHDKPGKPPSLCVLYQCGMVQHREWICVEHTGYPRQRAVQWWQTRAPGKPVPTTAAEALANAESLAKPLAICVKAVGKFTEITAARFLPNE